MPRQARQSSGSQIYHVMMRGINRQQIFEDEQDYEKYLQVLAKCQKICKFKLFAYCLMGNHIHLLLQTQQEALPLIIKRLNCRFVYWYNIKYERKGHLFQDRYKSEPVETEAYLLSVLRYIHQNPLKAGISKKLSYQFSSYDCYLRPCDNLIDTDFIFQLLPPNQFADFNNEQTDFRCLDIDETPITRLTEEQAQTIMLKISDCQNASEFQALPPQLRNNYFAQFAQTGLSLRQISRLTGYGRGLIQMYWKKADS